MVNTVTLNRHTHQGERSDNFSDNKIHSAGKSRTNSLSQASDVAKKALRSSPGCAPLNSALPISYAGLSCGAKEGGNAASLASKRRGVRTTAQPPESDASSSIEGCDPDGRTQPPSLGDCDQVLGPDSYRKCMGREDDNQEPAPTETRTPTWHRNRLKEEGERVP
jgi:hypothetical protein